MEQLFAHLVGDYVLQSDWMAQNKTKRMSVALIHALAYTAPFLLLTQNVIAVLVICLTHAVIDRYRLARYVVWIKEWLSPIRPRPLAECPLGYDPEKPPWLSTWLLILTDNTMHLIINYAALRWL